jgi:hypothetical protein
MNEWTNKWIKCIAYQEILWLLHLWAWFYFTFIFESLCCWVKETYSCFFVYFEYVFPFPSDLPFQFLKSSVRFFIFIYLFCSAGIWTQGLQLEPLYQPPSLFLCSYNIETFSFIISRHFYSSIWLFLSLKELRFGNYFISVHRNFPHLFNSCVYVVFSVY